MKSTIFLSAFCLIFFTACSERPGTAGDPSLSLSPATLCGTVQFSDGCGTETDSLIQFGLALIHHMTYDDAETIFDQVIQQDPDCFWGHWGKAMTFIHPLWPDMPDDEHLKMGWVLSQRALEVARKDREKLFGAALAAYYENGSAKTEQERLLAYEEAWKTAREQRPEDLEAKLFHVLIRLANVSPNDKTYAVNLEVGAAAEEVLTQIPDHPGGFHYAIHAYDLPPLAHKAVRVARNYSDIAPDIPHALHMPTHIFTRLGHWQESIDWNSRSARAAWKMPVNGQVSLHYLHALDYLVYAHLQQAEDEEAQAVRRAMDTLSGPLQAHAASAYALAAIPARLAIEKKQWAEAAQLTVPRAQTFPWEKFPQFEALIHFARGIGAARIGRTDVSQDAVDRLTALQTALGTSAAARYWVDQIEIQKTAVQAWLAFANRNVDEALALMETAAALEDATEKSPITPGELVPVRELFGDLLLAIDRPADALAQYERSLERNPRRFNTVYSAGKAAELAGETAQANTYFEQLLQLKGKAASERAELTEAMKRVEKS